MTRQEYFEKAKAAKIKYETAVNATSEVLQAFPKGDMGLTPDAVKASLEFKAAKRAYDNAANDLRNFNQDYTKTFKAELAAERKQKRLDRINKQNE